MSDKRNVVIDVIIGLLCGLLKGILKGHYDFQRQAIEEWNAEQRAAFARSFEDKLKK